MTQEIQCIILLLTAAAARCGSALRRWEDKQTNHSFWHTGKLRSYFHCLLENFNWFPRFLRQITAILGPFHFLAYLTLAPPALSSSALAGAQIAGGTRTQKLESQIHSTLYLLPLVYSRPCAAHDIKMWQYDFKISFISSTVISI